MKLLNKLYCFMGIHDQVHYEGGDRTILEFFEQSLLENINIIPRRDEKFVKSLMEMDKEGKEIGLSLLLHKYMWNDAYYQYRDLKPSVWKCSRCGKLIDNRKRIMDDINHCVKKRACGE